MSSHPPLGGCDPMSSSSTACCGVGRGKFLLAALTWAASVLSSARACTIRLGGALAATGRYESYGEQVKNGWTLWAERLNEQGGLNLPSGRCVVAMPLDLRDDKSSSELSSEILEAMLNVSSPDFAAVDFVIGPASSGITLGNSMVAQRHQRILFSTGASETLYNGGNEYIFSSLTPGNRYMSSGLQLLRSRGAATVVFAHEAKAFSASVCRGANATAHALGMRVAGYYEYEPGKTNFADLVYQIKALDADVYVGCGHLNDVTYLIGNANVLNVNPFALLVTHASDQRIVQNVGIPNSHGLLSPTQWDKSLEVQDDDGFFGSAQDFFDLYQARFGAPPAYQAAYSAAMGYSLQKAIESAGSLDTEAVKMALWNLSLTSFYGLLEYSAPGDASGLIGTQPHRPMVTTQILNGSVGVVAPVEVATMNLDYPMPTWAEKALLLYPCPQGTVEDGFAPDGSSSALHVMQADIATASHCRARLVVRGDSQITLALLCARSARRRHGQRTSRHHVLASSAPLAPCAPERYQHAAALSTGPLLPAGNELPTPCANGTKRSETGGSAPQDCAPCEPEAEAGQLECSMCPRGSFTSNIGTSACTSCEDAGPLGSTTEDIASSDASDCQCPGETYMPVADKSCQPCPEGMSCAFGSKEQSIGEVGKAWPVARRGFMTRTSAPLLVFKCLLEEHCPGGSCQDGACSVQTCAAHRDTNAVACGRCVAGAYQSGSECLLCEVGLDSLPLVFVIVSVLVLLSAVTLAINRDMIHQTRWAVGVMVSLACLFAAIQTTSVYLALNMKWMEPLASLMKALSILTFDLSHVKKECSMSIDPVSQQLARQLIPPIFLTYIALVLVVKRRFAPVTHLAPEFLNTAGTILMNFFVSICISVFDPLVCYAHPGVRGYTSMRSDPSVLCFNSREHTAMLVIGIAACVLTPLPFLSTAIFAVWKYPRYVAMHDIAFMKAFRFLFFRFEPSAYFFGVALLLRNLLICLVPVMIRNDAAAQILAAAALMIVWIVSQCLLRPWRNSAANTLDGAMSGCILLVLVCGAVGGAYTASEITTQATSVFVLVAFLSMWFVLIAWNLFKQLSKSDVYDMLICHNKAGGAAQAKLIKLLVAEQGGQRVFLDSDELQQLDNLLDTVKAKVRNLVVYLTHETLTRPWCAGEVVTAMKTGKRITVVLTPSFMAPTSEQLEMVDAYLEVGGADLLVQYGIAVGDVRDSYAQLVAAQGCVHIRVERDPTNTRHFQHLVDRLIQKQTKSAAVPDAASPGCLVISADPCDAEAAAAACILISRAKPSVASFLKEGVSFLSDHMDMGIVGHCLAITVARALVVILSTDTLSSRHQLEIIAHVKGLNEKDHGPVAIPVNVDFSPPSTHYYSRVLPQIWPEVSEAQVRRIGVFFRTASCPYSTRASDQVLRAQIHAIVRRIPLNWTSASGIGAGIYEDDLTHIEFEDNDGEEEEEE
eukprot:CAMPEP_0115362042 /NCGR_PEP_ID=MMETSP0270-20121206/102507_1 /TAXON_ID=71861 /ORGANISM="Scrippsiella trochoidea, Strain CCMP3099" /LENGTH=1452 /DNA_ID=CAMNT_0002784613 /DNA_START=28 /DNA_END=4385 /DNA_ORIENTATION=+